MSAKEIVKILEKDYGYYFNKTDNKHQYEWILDLITDVEKVVNKSAIGVVSKSFDCKTCKYLPKEYDTYCDNCSTNHNLYESNVC